MGRPVNADLLRHDAIQAMIRPIAEAQKRIMYHADRDLEILENVAVTLTALQRLRELEMEQKQVLDEYKARAKPGGPT